MNKVRPPFPRLPSFHAVVIVLSYMRYEDDYQLLLRELSHTTKKFAKLHKDQLQAFVTGKYRGREIRIIDFDEYDGKIEEASISYVRRAAF